MADVDDTASRLTPCSYDGNVTRMTTSEKPELGELKPGHRVMVRRSYNDMRRRSPEEQYIPATVVKAARVWIELEGTEGNWKRTWRMRRDTQDQGTQYSGSNDSFLTMDQYAWTETRDWALAVIKDHGLTVESRSPWRGRETELAEILAVADSLS